MARIKDRISDLLDAVVMYAIALWLLFVTLPSLDKEKTLKDGSTLYPSRGTIGSCYQTKDGQHYVRTGSGVRGRNGGVRKVGKQLGMQLIARSRRIRNLAIARRVVLVFTVLLIATSLAVLAN